MSKLKEIILPNSGIKIQDNLLPKIKGSYNPFPDLTHSFDDVLAKMLNEGIGGLDLEFDSKKAGKPSILGIASDKYAKAISWDESKALDMQYLCKEKGLILVAH